MELDRLVGGQLKLVGLDGLNVSGDVTFQINTTSSAMTLGTHNVAASTFSLTASNLDLSVGNPKIFEITGSLSVTRSADGTLGLAVQNAQVSVNVNGTPVVSVGGSATFTISPVSGFHMQTFSVGGFSLFGVSAGLSGTPPGSLTSPAPTASE